MRKTCITEIHSIKLPKIKQKDLIADLSSVVLKYKEYLEATEKFANNPSVKPDRDKARGMVDLAESLVQHLKGNSLIFNIHKDR
jgi:hypothetical protein